MLEKTRRFQSDSSVDTFDYDTNGPRFGRYPYRKAGVAHIPDDAVPLFLSDEFEETEPQPYEYVRERPRKRTFTASRVLAGSVAILAAAAVASLFSTDTTRAIIVNAKASLAAVTAATRNQSGTAVAQLPAVKPRLANSVQVATLGVQPAAVGQTTTGNGQIPSAQTPAVAATPSREEISAALKTARQIQPEIQPPAPVQPARRLDSDTLAGMMNRAKTLLTVGDITSARLLLERAADAQEASAAFMLGQTYDPAVLGTQDVRNITPDLAAARSWYEKAAELGSADAQQRLAQMQ